MREFGLNENKKEINFREVHSYVNTKNNMGKMIVVSCLLFLAAFHCTDSLGSIVNLNPSNLLRSSEIHPKVREDKIKFVLYTRKHPNGFRLIRNNDNNLRRSGYDSSHQTKVIIHGFVNNYVSGAIQYPKNAYLSSGKYNVIAVDWGEYAFPYLLAASRTRAIGHFTGLMISYLMNSGNLRASDLHFIGHSLGAHVAGFAAEKLKSKPARITGLDPAAPIFADNPPSERLGEEDAEFVDVIHTSVPTLGMAKNIGHADFYPAGGKNQPRCSGSAVEIIGNGENPETGSCDHGESYIYFAESIKNKKLFPAVKCNSVNDALQRRCTGRKTAFMGEPAIQGNPRGVFYVDDHSLNHPLRLSGFRKARKSLLIHF